MRVKPTCTLKGVVTYHPKSIHNRNFYAPVVVARATFGSLTYHNHMKKILRVDQPIPKEVGTS